MVFGFRGRNEERERESLDIAMRYIMIFLSRHLVPIRRTILESKRFNLGTGIIKKTTTGVHSLEFHYIFQFHG